MSFKVSKFKFEVDMNIGKGDSFKTINCHGIRRKGLSLKAKGLLAYLLCSPKGWIHYRDNIKEDNQIGETAFKNLMKELTDNGYVEIVKERDGKGRYSKIKHKLMGKPKSYPESNNHQMENQSMENHTLENQSMEKSRYSNKDYSSKEYLSKEREHSSHNSKDDFSPAYFKETYGAKVHSLFNYWNSLPNVPKTKSGNYKSCKRAYSYLYEILSDYKYSGIKKAMDVYSKLLVAPYTMFTSRHGGTKPFKVGLDNFLDYDNYQLKTIEQNDCYKSLRGASLFLHCLEGESHCLSKFAVVSKDKHPKITQRMIEKSKQDLGLHVDPTDPKVYNIYVKASEIFMEKFEKDFKDYINVSAYKKPLPFLSFFFEWLEGQEIKYFYLANESIYDKFKIYLSENGYLEEFKSRATKRKKLNENVVFY